MSDTTPDTSPEANDPAVEEWKPEPRTWAWKDLFTAPMLAFKPKCMLIGAATLTALMVFAWLWGKVLVQVADIGPVHALLLGLGIVIAATLFSLGASLIAVFMKADLLDDEFLSLGEALGQYKKRVSAAIMVPGFLAVTVLGFLLLIYLGMLLASVPYLGSLLLALLYPLAYLFALLTVLVGIAVLLSIFLVPSIIAIRKHGWFDNVIDTFEAVGTKPHVVVLNLALTLLMVAVTFGIAHGSMNLLSRAAATAPGIEAASMDHRAQQIKGLVQPWVSPFWERGYIDAARNATGHKLLQNLERRRQSLQEALQNADDSDQAQNLQERLDALDEIMGAAARMDRNQLNELEALLAVRGLHGQPGLRELQAVAGALTLSQPGPSVSVPVRGWQGFTGLIAGLWQSLLLIVIAGYAFNVIIAGGMLTYLYVREDDYWDDEDLEDLDKLAKELEEEAKAEAAKAEAEDAAAPAPAAADSTPAEGQPAPESKPAEGDKPAEDKPAEDKPAEDKPAEDKAAEGDKPAEDKPADGDKPADSDKPAEGDKKPEQQQDQTTKDGEDQPDDQASTDDGEDKPR